MNSNLIIGCLSMSLAILTNSLSGPMFKYMENNEIKPSLSASWRGHCMLIFLIPLSILEIIKTGEYIHYFDRKKDLPYQIYVHVLLAGFGWAGTLLFWINGLNYISTVRASLFVNLHPLLMVIYLYFIGIKLSLFDWGGVFLALSGMVIMSSQQLYQEFIETNDDINTSKSLSTQIFGSFLCFLAACSEFGVLINRKKIKKYVPLMQYTAVTSLITTIIASIDSLLFEKTIISLSYSTHSSHSLFGWIDPYWRVGLLSFGFINGVLCQAGFNFAMQFIDPLLFSSLLLLTIPTTGLVSWICGIEDIPDIYTIVGGSILLIGIGMITYGEQKRSAQEKLTTSTNIDENNNDNNNDNNNNNNNENNQIELELELEMSDQSLKKDDNSSFSQSLSSLTSPISITGFFHKSPITLSSSLSTTTTSTSKTLSSQKYSQIQQDDVEDET